VVIFRSLKESASKTFKKHCSIVYHGVGCSDVTSCILPMVFTLMMETENSSKLRHIYTRKHDVKFYYPYMLMDWIHLGQDRKYRQASVRTVLKLRFM